MRSILGINMNTTSIQKVETNWFARADLEDRLLMVDDDMDMSALTKTNYIKSIVTSECQMDVERKGIRVIRASCMSDSCVSEMESSPLFMTGLTGSSGGRL